MSHRLEYSSTHARSKFGRWVGSRFSWVHLLVPAALWLCLAGVALADSSDRGWRSAAPVAASTALGPMAGAVCRDFQGCCLDFSLSLLPYCAGPLAAALLIQFVVPARGWPSRAVRWLAWLIGTCAWFAGAVISFGHAFS